MTYLELLRQVEDQARRYGETLQTPCDERRLQRLRRRVRDELGADLPEEYAGFLRLTDGMNYNGLYVHPSETLAISDHPEYVMTGFVETNLGLRRDDDRFGDLLVFGEDSLDFYARRVPTGEFQVLSRVPLDLMETVPSFDALICPALRRCLL